VRQQEDGLLDTDFPLSLFNEERSAAVAEYERFLNNAVDDDLTWEDDTDLAGKGLIPLVIPMANESYQDMTKGPSSSIEHIAHQVCQESNLSIPAMQSTSQVRAIAQARRIFVLRAVEYGARPSEIAAFLNRVPSAISNLLRTCDRCGV
jgi:hypothetical protein